MRVSERLWEPKRLYDGGLDLRIRKSASALELARDLLPSKPVVARAFGRGQLASDGKVLLQNDQLAVGACVTLTFWPLSVPDAETLDVVSGGTSADILYRDPVLLAANKPAGLLVHDDGTGAPTLTAWVQRALVRQGSHALAQAVQRLDVDTTGVVLFSLTEEFQPALDAMVAGHEMRKRYLALVEGTLSSASCDTDGWLPLDGRIARDRHNPHKMRVGRTGKLSRTRVRTLATRGGLSLVLAELETGRRHQIRVHLSHAGCPIVGDQLYGARRTADGLMLHAWQETLTHPVTNESLCVEASVPDRFRILFPQVDEFVSRL